MIKLIDDFENCVPGAVNENRAGEKPLPGSVCSGI